MIWPCAATLVVVAVAPVKRPCIEALRANPLRDIDLPIAELDSDTDPASDRLSVSFRGREIVRVEMGDSRSEEVLVNEYTADVVIDGRPAVLTRVGRSCVKVRCNAGRFPAALALNGDRAYMVS